MQATKRNIIKKYNMYLKFMNSSVVLFRIIAAVENSYKSSYIVQYL